MMQGYIGLITYCSAHKQVICSYIADSYDVELQSETIERSIYEMGLRTSL